MSTAICNITHSNHYVHLRTQGVADVLRRNCDRGAPLHGRTDTISEQRQQVRAERSRVGFAFKTKVEGWCLRRGHAKP